MIKLRPIADDDPVLDQSRLLQAMELAFAYADTHGGIGLAQTKAFCRSCRSPRLRNQVHREFTPHFPHGWKENPQARAVRQRTHPRS